MFLSLLATALLIGSAPAPSTTVANRPVETLDLARYGGQWHEIAHLPIRVERKCADSVTATYSSVDGGDIRAAYSCRTRAGKTDRASGVARRDDGAPGGAFKVRFVPGWLAWLPKMWGDYWVIELDPDYQWAVIGGPDARHLWVMSRTPRMQRTLFERLREGARRRGYAVGQLVMTGELE